MPLHDLTTSPQFLSWKSFNAVWASKIVDRLNGDCLPDRYAAAAEPPAQPHIEIDVATLDTHGTAVRTSPLFGQNGTGVAVAPTAAYSPPEPGRWGEVDFSDAGLYEVRVHDRGGAGELVAAVELVSKSNKDRPESRHQFAVKIASYLNSGVSVAVVDIVTDRSGDLHGELCEALGASESFAWESASGLSAVAYRSLRGRVIGRSGRVEAWPHALEIGRELPTLPLWLDIDLAVPLELEPTFTAARKSLRMS